jgi:hypothetical protein
MLQLSFSKLTPKFTEKVVTIRKSSDFYSGSARSDLNQNSPQSFQFNAETASLLVTFNSFVSN